MLVTQLQRQFSTGAGEKIAAGNMKMAIFDKCTLALKEVMHSIVARRSENNDKRNIIESDFEHEKYKDKLDSRDPGMNSYGAFEDSVELEQFQQLKERLLMMLHVTCAKNLSCFVDVSMEQLDHLAQDVMRMSHSEPCGLHGAIIFIGLQRKNSRQTLATIQGDNSVTPTFEVYVTLKEDTSRWKALKKAFLTLKECLFNGVWKETPIVLCSGFQLEKKRLYRPAQ